MVEHLAVVTKTSAEFPFGKHDEARSAIVHENNMTEPELPQFDSGWGEFLTTYFIEFTCKMAIFILDGAVCFELLYMDAWFCGCWTGKKPE